MEIANEKVVIIDYTLKNDTGELIDTSEGKEPLSYIHGTGHIIPGLESALEGKVAGDKIKAVIPPHEAYGVRDESLSEVVPIGQFQDQNAVQVGIQFQVETEQGPRIATVTQVEGEEVTVDFNHPLADQTLHFDVEVIEVRDATPEEIDHGHVHGPGGHHH